MTRGHEAVSGEAWDTEMTSEMEQVYGADVAVEGYQVEVFGTGEQDHHSGHVHVLEVDPEVGLAGVEGVSLVAGGDQVLQPEASYCLRIWSSAAGS